MLANQRPTNFKAYLELSTCITPTCVLLLSDVDPNPYLCTTKGDLGICQPLSLWIMCWHVD